MIAHRDERLPRGVLPNAKVKCEICGAEKNVQVLFCMREGWPECCEVGGSPQTMALLVTRSTIMWLRRATRKMAMERPITGLMNWPLFYDLGLRRGLDIPRKNVKGVKA